MTTILTILETVGIVLAGTAGRFVLFAAGAFVLALPALAVAWARFAWSGAGGGLVRG
jgi:hypothetical protein